MAHDSIDRPEQATSQRLSRRAFLRRAALGVSLPALGGVLGACQAPAGSRTSQTADPVHFGVIGDFGFAGKDAELVANLVKSWKPGFILTVGDNNYYEGAAKTIDTNIGQYYGDYIGNYRGKHGTGADTNRFWPVLGNHDWLTDNAQPYLDYFTLPGEYYYTFTQGPVQFFMLDSNKQTPDGAEADSKQGQWLRLRLAESIAPWRVVVFHHTPFSSGTNGPTPRMRWPFAQWGASIVLAGHEHVYERFASDGLTYLTNGLGGAERYEAIDHPKESQFFFNKAYGAMLVDADTKRMSLQFITPDNAVIDRVELTSPKV